MKSKQDITSFIVDWFAENTTKTKEELLGNLGADYLHYGWIDSFKFISFISAAEKEFEIIFTSDDYRDETFSTVQGLIDMIGTKIALNEPDLATSREVSGRVLYEKSRLRRRLFQSPPSAQHRPQGGHPVGEAARYYGLRKKK